MNGYELVEDVFTPGEIAGFRVAVGETIDRLARGFLTPFEASRPELPVDLRLEEIARRDLAYAAALLHGVLADAQRDPRIAGLPRHPKLRALIEERLRPLQVTGTDLRVRANVPSLAGSRHRWHQDVTDLTPTASACETVRLACWIPMSDVDERTGCLELVPEVFEAPFAHESGDAGSYFIRDERLAAYPKVAVPMALGSALFLDRLTPHQALPNRSDTVRWSLVLWVKAM
jgi:hypothetical protein